MQFAPTLNYALLDFQQAVDPIEPSLVEVTCCNLVYFEASNS